ncbi:hypothetical protein [Lentzea albida]|uniref:Uncharacterized protein n=1 Tax=Lentzea albida TaxID=65499 RepID=A0A1H9VDS2_9PSEU|nr:hypothetical protein [Lentzea albida]SES19709.1 hypothetical protein SAMN04488000_11832 [Lentzea albida]
MFQPYLAEYRYYALFLEDGSMKDVVDAKGLYRSLGGFDEAQYRGHGGWEWSDDLSEAREHDSRYAYREVTPAETDRLRRRIDAERPAPASPPQEKPGALELLEARRRAEPVDGHYYFAEFDSLADVVDLTRAHALVRCSATGRGAWEAYVREGVWTRGRGPLPDTALPVGRENAEQVIRAREATATRYFEVRPSGADSNVLVCHTASGDQISDDLGWRSADVLRNVEPGWWVREYSERGFAGARRFATTRARADRFRDRPDDYFAVFPDEDDVYDFSKVLFVVRRFFNPYYGRHEGSTYERWTSDGWRPTEPPVLHGLLPISDEEFGLLTAPRPRPARGAGDLRR